MLFLPVPCERFRVDGGAESWVSRERREGLRLMEPKLERRWGSQAYYRVRSAGRPMKESRWDA
jgi:hypothetical protein